MQHRVFSRRRFLGASGAGLLAIVGWPAVLASNAGCQSVQQVLGPKQAGGATATVRYMGHFTALGDTARDRAQKAIDGKFREKYPNISIQWEETAWETIGEKYMAAWSANTAPDISLFSPANTTQAVRLGSLENLSPVLDKWSDQDKSDLSRAW
jgi:ABC-type glycerol-3-phosphate transport system substrate-binding protein